MSPAVGSPAERLLCEVAQYGIPLNFPPVIGHPEITKFFCFTQRDPEKISIIPALGRSHVVHVIRKDSPRNTIVVDRGFKRQFRGRIKELISILISLRAGLNEEISFRLFLFPFLVWFLIHFTDSQKVIIGASALITAFIHGLMHPGFFVAFLMSLVLIYIYYKKGIFSAIFFHFIIDAIPFTLHTLML